MAVKKEPNPAEIVLGGRQFRCVLGLLKKIRLDFLKNMCIICLYMPNVPRDNFQDIVDDFVPSKEALVSTQDVVMHFKVKERPFALRTLTKYATLGLIPKPIIIGNKGFYEKDYIFTQLDAIYVLKSVFQRSLENIKEISSNKSSNLRQTVEILHGFVKWIKDNMGEVEGCRSFAVWLINDSYPRIVVNQYLDGVAKGDEPAKVVEMLKIECLEEAKRRSEKVK